MERKITCIILDDELPALNLLKEFIGELDDFELIGSFKNTQQASEFLQTSNVDVIFTDIQMPGRNGMEFARELQGDYQLVFTTAYSDYAGYAFELDANDYLIKPFSKTRFQKSILKIRENLRLKQLSEQMDNMQEVASDHIVIRSNHTTHKVFHNKILFLEAFQEYVKIITKTQRYITFERMKNMEAILPSDQFLRVHRSYIVSMSKVRSISGNLLQIDEHFIPVSRDSKEMVIKRIFSPKGN